VDSTFYILAEYYMNERIKELAEQVYGSAHYDDFKFAELIIKECCKITDEVERADLPVVASKFVKAHFGVE
jgi:hypothetical protein